MRKMLNKKSGFTLIELMIVVAILGILAAIAIPAFVTYVRRSKTTEANETLEQLFKSASQYYTAERVSRGLQGGNYSNCMVDSENLGFTPGTSKQQVTDPKTMSDDVTNSFSKHGLGFNFNNAYYFNYIISADNNTTKLLPANPITGDVQTQCYNSALTASTTRYTFSANGDLDGDGTISTFELAVGTTPENELFHAAGVYVVNETE